MMKAKRDFDYYIAEAQKAEDRSYGLWKGINQCIRSVLETQRKKDKSLNFVADVLDEIAGDAKITCVNNLRTAAKQIRARKELVLI
jgi:hypothetical protein